MRQVYRLIAADNADVLAGTDLDPIPATATRAIIYAASTQADTILTVQTPEMPVARAILLPLRANAELRMDEDGGMIVPVMGGKLIISVDIVTGASVAVLVQTD